MLFIAVLSVVFASVVCPAGLTRMRKLFMYEPAGHSRMGCQSPRLYGKIVNNRSSRVYTLTIVNLQSSWGRYFCLQQVITENDKHIHARFVDIFKKSFEFVLRLIACGARTGWTSFQASPAAIFFTISDSDNFLCVYGGYFRIAGGSWLLVH